MNQEFTKHRDKFEKWQKESNNAGNMKTKIKREKRKSNNWVKHRGKSEKWPTCVSQQGNARDNGKHSQLIRPAVPSASEEARRSEMANGGLFQYLSVRISARENRQSQPKNTYAFDAKLRISTFSK
jgi:hypothetical protein